MERSFHESINSSLAKNVEPVTAWTDLPRFTRVSEHPPDFFDDSVFIEEIANDFLAAVNRTSQLHQLALVALAIKTEQKAGEKAHLHIIQLRTRDKTCVFKVNSFFSLHLKVLIICRLQP